MTFVGKRSARGGSARVPVALLQILFVVACGGDDDAAPAAPTATPPTPQVQQARELSRSPLQKRDGVFPVTGPSLDEPFVLWQKDQQLAAAAGTAIVPGRYSNTLNRLAQRASIDGVQVLVASDLACTQVPFGGGAATDRLMVLDGKLLDVFADMANGVALRETGRLTLSVNDIVDAAARHQMSVGTLCRASDPLAFPDTALTPAERDRSVELFTQWVGGLFFHEFGHIWGWHTLIGLRDRVLFPSGGFFSYTSAIEDNADLTSGILAAKAGHDAGAPKLAYDVMAFVYFYRRAPGSLLFANVQSWEVQYMQASPSYSSLAARKQLVDLGYAAWQQK